jgi:2-polyprenyl-3-methyl-5-hydroxy-6-metoxy-1,4-benzoquinol methylase/tetratricopeptide (TPR) repeat protein
MSVDRPPAVIWQEKRGPECACPLCGVNGPTDFVLQVRNPLPYSEYLDLYRCQTCGSCFYQPIELPAYENVFEGEYLLQFYLEQGAGIDSMIEPLVMLREAFPKARLLDVGCGCGFTVDFAQRVLGWEAVGVEPSNFARIGSDWLGVAIHQNLIEQVRELRPRQFDIVLSSEVIEHVKAPTEFLAILTRYLAPGGVLVLTTPNADFLRRDMSHTTGLEILSPGFHINLFSERALREFLVRSGLPHTTVVTRGHGLVAYASTRAFPTSHTAAVTKVYYRRYLLMLFEAHRENDPLATGIQYRLLKEYVNDGTYASAWSVLEQLERNFGERFGATLLKAEELPDRIASLASLEAIGKVVPYNIAGFLYYKGILLLNTGEHRAAARLFHTAFRIAPRLIALGPAYFGEVADLLWRMKFHEGLACLCEGRREEAQAAFEVIIGNLAQAEPEYSGVAVPPEIAAQTMLQSGIAALQLGQEERAVGWFQRAVAQERHSGRPGMVAYNAARHLGLAMAQAMERHHRELAGRDGELATAFLREVRGRLAQLEKQASAGGAAGVIEVIEGGINGLRLVHKVLKNRGLAYALRKIFTIIKEEGFAGLRWRVRARRP